MRVHQNGAGEGGFVSVRIVDEAVGQLAGCNLSARRLNHS